MYLRREDGEKIYIDEAAALGKGGEASVYGVTEYPNWAAKVYTDERATAERAAKLAVMRDHPPQVPVGSDDHVPIAWPVELLYDLKDRERVVGFLMPRAYRVAELIDFYNPQRRLEFSPLFDYRYLIRAARNLAATVRALHARNYIVGDLKHANILATETALITLVDTDSFQVVDPATGRVYPCPVRTPEYTPPELQALATGQEILLPEQDNFALAALIFQLLMEGTHPFAGVFSGDDDPPPFEARIAAGHFPYGANPGPYRPGARTAPPFSMLPLPLQALFLQCFDDGFINPAARPTAQQWQAALDDVKHALSHCADNPSHYYSAHLDACPWCERKTKQLRGVDPFPSPTDLTAWREVSAANADSVPAQVGVVVANAGSAPGWNSFTNNAPFPAAQNAPNADGSRFLRNLLGGVLGFFGLLFVGGMMLSEHPNPPSDWPNRIYYDHGDHVVTQESGNAQAAQNPPVNPGRRGMAFSPDGKTLATLSVKAILWNVQTGDVLHTLENQSQPDAGKGVGQAVAFSPDGKRLALNRNGCLALYDAKTGLQIHAVEMKTGIESLTFSPDGKTLAAAMEDGEQHPVRLWDSRTLIEQAELPNPSGRRYYANMVRFSPNGTKLICGGGDGGYQREQLIGWDVAAHKRIFQFDSYGSVQAVAFLNEKKFIALAGNETQYGEIQNSKFFLSKTLSGSTSAVSLSTNGKRQFLLSSSGEPLVRDTGKNTDLPILAPSQMYGAVDVAFSWDDKILAVSNSSGVQLYNLETGQETRAIYTQ